MSKRTKQTKGARERSKKANRARRELKPGPYERQGISVECPVCGVGPGVGCLGPGIQRHSHEERSKRAAVFAEMRIAGIKAQRIRRHFALAVTEQQRAARRKNGPVTRKRAADLSPAELEKYGL